MARKHCHRRIVTPLIPRGLRPRLKADQLCDLALCHVVNLDAIASGSAEPSILWDMVGATLTWFHVASLLDLGIDEMTLQLEVSTRLVERFGRTGLVRWSGTDYQLAKRGLIVMDELARVVDRHTAIVAAEWSETEVNRIAADSNAIRLAKKQELAEHDD
jgi:hypothetical protein